MSLITAEQVDEAMKRICEENPERVNPANGGVCVYLDHDGNACLIGEFLLQLADLGGNRVEVESYLRGHLADPVRRLPWVKDLVVDGLALRTLSEWQRAADYGDEWGDVLAWSIE